MKTTTSETATVDGLMRLIINDATYGEIRDYAERLAASAAVQAVPTGWKLVPIEPPDTMLMAAGRAYKAATNSLAGYFADRCAYRAMLAAAPQPPQAQAVPTWQPISTAPRTCKVIVAYKNSLGKWRRVMASYATAEEIEEAGEDSGYGDTGAKPGWYEECETSEALLPVDGTPELWHELPPIAAPEAPADPVQRPGDHVPGGQA